MFRLIPIARYFKKSLRVAFGEIKFEIFGEHVFFFIALLAVFRTAPQLTERLEEADFQLENHRRTIETSLIVF